MLEYNIKTPDSDTFPWVQSTFGDRRLNESLIESLEASQFSRKVTSLAQPGAHSLNSSSNEISVWRIPRPVDPYPSRGPVVNGEWAKNIEEDQDDTHMYRAVYMRVFPNMNLSASCSTRGIPKWTFDKSSYINNIKVTSSDLFFKGELIYITIGDSNIPLGLGASVDGVLYPNMGHVYHHTSEGRVNHTSEGVSTSKETKTLSLENRICMGGLDALLSKGDKASIQSIRKDTHYGWNGDLRGFLNLDKTGISTLGITASNIMAFLTPKSFNTPLDSTYFQAVGAPIIPFVTLYDNLKGQPDKAAVKHPLVENTVLTHPDLVLAQANNDIVVLYANTKLATLHKDWETSAFDMETPFLDIFNFVLEEVFNTHTEEMKSLITKYIFHSYFPLDTQLRVRYFHFNKKFRVLTRLAFMNRITQVGKDDTHNSTEGIGAVEQEIVLRVGEIVSGMDLKPILNAFNDTALKVLTSFSSPDRIGYLD